MEGGVAGEEAGGEWRGSKEKARSRRHGGQTHTSWHIGGGPCLGGLTRRLECEAEERAKVGGPVQSWSDCREKSHVVESAVTFAFPHLQLNNCNMHMRS